MKTDRYTKAVLSIIAACLLILVIQQVDLFSRAYAGQPENPPLSTEKEYRQVPVNEDGSMDVRIIEIPEINIQIVGVDTYDELEVEITDIDLSRPLNIQLKD